MKKFLLIIFGLSLNTLNINAQVIFPDTMKPDTSLYDTLVVFNPIAEYPTWDDDITFSWIDTTYRDRWYPDYGGVIYEPDTIVCEHTVHYLVPFNSWKYEKLAVQDSHSLTNFPFINKSVIGGEEEFAQPWHLDTAAIICGVYADFFRPAPGMMYRGEYFHLLDSNLNHLARAQQVCLGESAVINTDGSVLYPAGTEFHAFYFDKQNFKLKDFYLSAEAQEAYFFGHSCSIYDPDTSHQKFFIDLGYPYDEVLVGLIPKDADGQYWDFSYWTNKLITNTNVSRKNMQEEPLFPLASNEDPAVSLADHPVTDTIKLYQSPYSPLIKRNGEWISFADDSAYHMKQKMVLKLLPIILVPKPQTDTSSLNDAVLEDNLWVYPNPAKDKLNVKSGFKMQRIEVFSAAGNKIFGSDVTGNEVALNLTEFEKGVYFINIQTIRGTTTRKFIKQ